MGRLLKTSLIPLPFSIGYKKPVPPLSIRFNLIDKGNTGAEVGVISDAGISPDKVLIYRAEAIFLCYFLMVINLLTDVYPI